MGLADIAGEREHQGEGMLGGGNGVAAGSIHHHHAVVCGSRAVDIVNAHTGPADGFEVLRRSEYRRGDFRFGPDHKAMIVTDDGEQFIRLEASFDIDGNFRGAAQSIHTFF